MFKKIITAAVAFFTGIFTKKTTSTPPATTEQMLDHVISIVESVKAVVDSQLAIVITSLIPGAVDDYIRATASMVLPKVIAGLTFIKSTGLTLDDEQILTQGINAVRFSDDADKNAFYHSLAARLLVIFSDGKVTWSEAVGVVEFYFKNKYLKAI
jgi:hypothetical protein